MVGHLQRQRVQTYDDRNGPTKHLLGFIEYHFLPLSVVELTESEVVIEEAIYELEPLTPSPLYLPSPRGLPNPLRYHYSTMANLSLLWVTKNGCVRSNSFKKSTIYSIYVMGTLEFLPSSVLITAPGNRRHNYARPLPKFKYHPYQ
ncbi:hypothetical protein P691DRAFT_566324 [Macrolepiota fuliginosa MF-IS2]|uniref:Uncharacterized protein n=1 Tax=Macrolepiota fuliginosa MF-IS2 TaxID=1400762 RepID=A0A9P5XED0_9AGAR|nr:hypothetical protein P691DRAFT_566324 [Macrolepiota fuliginosa MF-IS2]